MSNVRVRLLDSLACKDWPSVRRICKQILSGSPQDPDALHALGAACWFEGDPARAIEYISAAVEQRPDPVWHNNLGVLYIQLRRWDDAIRTLRRSVELDPGAVNSTVHLAAALSRAGHAGEAIELLQRLLERVPTHRGALESLGAAYRLAGKQTEAWSILSQAAEIHPDSAGIRRNLIDTCIALQRWEEAHEHALRFTKLEPGSESFVRLALTAWETGNRTQSVEAREAALASGLTDPALHSALLLLSLYDDSQSDKSIHQSHSFWALTHRPPNQSPATHPPATHANDPSTERKLRIGFIAAQLYRSAATPFQVPLIRSLDRAGFAPYIYLLSSESSIPDIDAVHRSLKHLDDEEAAETIRADRIDILVDCSGHQSFGRPRIFALQPAPVQVVRSGYPATTGVLTMKAFFTDSVLTPEGTEDYYSEPVVRNPAGAFLFEPPAHAPCVSKLPALRNGAVIFGLFQKAAKLSEGNLSLAAAVLRNVPGSQLLFHHEHVAYDDPDSSFTQWIRAILSQSGIGADRLRFIGPRYSHEHLAAIGSVDIALDTLPYNGHATTCDCLWMGIPVVTLRGATLAGRVTASLLTQTGFSELVGETPADYIRIAVSLARDLPRLDNLRATMRDQVSRSALTDITARTQDFERACRSLWRAWCSGQAIHTDNSMYLSRST